MGRVNSYSKKKIKKNMGMTPLKVFVQLNHGMDKSYLLAFARNITRRDLKSILNLRYEKAVPLLMEKSKKSFLILSKDRPKARMIADLILMDGYTAERLA